MRTRFVDGHHIRHWSEGGPTDLDNLVSLCRRHHRLVHERGCSVRLDESGEARFTNQHGIEIPNVPRSPPSTPATLRDLNSRRGLVITSRTPRIGSRDRLDLSLAVDAISSSV